MLEDSEDLLDQGVTMTEMNSDNSTASSQGKANVATANRSLGGAESRPFLSSLIRRPLLSAEQEINLARRIQAGDLHAKDILVESNERLALDVAKHYQTASMPLEDLFQEGMIGLITAAGRFDPARGCRFSTFAVFWIRQAISRAVESKSKPIRIPSHVTDCLRKLEKVRETMTRENGIEPTNEQLSEFLGIPLQKLEMLIQANMETLSLDNMVGEDGNATLVSLLSDENAIDPQQSVLSEERQDLINAMLSKLTPREREVIRYRFAMEGESSQILQDIGAKLNLSRERVRQIELQAIRKLQFAARRQEFNHYVNE